MTKGKKKTTKQADRQAPKVSYNYKPEGMTLEQWQIALRQQAAIKEAEQRSVAAKATADAKAKTLAQQEAQQ